MDNCGLVRPVLPARLVEEAIAGRPPAIVMVRQQGMLF